MSENNIAQIKSQIPEHIYNVFTKEWNNFVDSCSQNTSGMIEDETGDGEEFDKYFKIFMTYPH